MRTLPIYTFTRRERSPLVGKKAGVGQERKGQSRSVRSRSRSPKRYLADPGGARDCFKHRRDNLNSRPGHRVKAGTALLALS